MTTPLRSTTRPGSPLHWRRFRPESANASSSVTTSTSPNPMSPPCSDQHRHRQVRDLSRARQTPRNPYHARRLTCLTPSSSCSPLPHAPDVGRRAGCVCRWAGSGAPPRLGCEAAWLAPRPSPLPAWCGPTCRRRPASDLRPGATATTRVVSTSCSDTGTDIGDSGPLTVGAATIRLRARAGTCEGIRVETSFTIPGYSETGLIGSGHDSPLRAMFTIVGMQEMGLAPVRPATALIVLPPGERICSLTHAGRPQDDLRNTMAAAQTESWSAGWTFVAQPLPADAAQWEWRLQVCGSDRTLIPANLPPARRPDWCGLRVEPPNPRIHDT